MKADNDSRRFNKKAHFNSLWYYAVLEEYIQTHGDLLVKQVLGKDIVLFQKELNNANGKITTLMLMAIFF